MTITPRIRRLVGQPVGLSFKNGQGTSGIFCGVREGAVLLIEYSYQEVFPLKQYPMEEVDNLYPFPSCRSIFNGNRPQRRVY